MPWKALRDTGLDRTCERPCDAGKNRPVLVRLRRALEIIRRRVLPKSLLGQAIDYTLSRWEALTRYGDDGRLEIDNNLCENAIRPTALGKRISCSLATRKRGESAVR